MKITKPLTPTQPLALRICDIFHRRHSTPWQPKEVRAYKSIARHIEEEDLQMIERTYKAQWPPNRDKNILRHDVYTWLNNYATEVDRARIWCESHPIKAVRKIIPIELPSRPAQPPSAEDVARTEIFMEQYRQRKQLKGTT
jgi:hypothetical protein